MNVPFDTLIVVVVHIHDGSASTWFGDHNISLWGAVRVSGGGEGRRRFR